MDVTTHCMHFVKCKLCLSKTDAERVLSVCIKKHCIFLAFRSIWEKIFFCFLDPLAFFMEKEIPAGLVRRRCDFERNKASLAFNFSLFKALKAKFSGVCKTESLFSIKH